MNPSESVMARIVGGVLSWIGVAFALLVLYFAYLTVSGGRSWDLARGLILAAFAVLSCFCLLVGFRMFVNRPNAYGSILSPTAWGALGVLFAAGALALIAVGLENARSAIGVAGLFAMSAGCFISRAKLIRRSRR